MFPRVLIWSFMMNSAPSRCVRFTEEAGFERVTPGVYQPPILDRMEQGNGWPSTISKKTGCGDTSASGNVGKKCYKSSNACERDTLLAIAFTWYLTTSPLTCGLKFASGQDTIKYLSFLLRRMLRGSIGSKQSSLNPKNSSSPTPITNHTRKCNVNGMLSYDIATNEIQKTRKLNGNGTSCGSRHSNWALSNCSSIACAGITCTPNWVCKIN